MRSTVDLSDSGSLSTHTRLRRSAVRESAFVVPRSPAFRSCNRQRRAEVVTLARRRAAKQQEEEDDEAEEASTGTRFLGGLFGSRTGTQRLKAGEEAGNESSSNQPASKGKKSAPGGFLQTARIARKDQNTVFVAGATGRLGLRIVRELLLAGFKVRAGARNTQKAQNYVDVAASLGLLTSDAVKRLQIVPVDLEDPGSISAALGNATRVVQAIGAAENNVLDFGAPKRIDNKAAVALVNASVEAGVTQYVMVTSLGTGKFGWPASALNLFGGILTQKRQAEKALISSGLNYTIVRPGGMERPGDDYKKTNNVRLSTPDKLFGGQVSRLQVAELITSAVISPEIAGSKILEVVAETTAPKVDYEQLLRNYGTDTAVAEPESEEEDLPSASEPPARPSRPPKRAPPRRKQPASKKTPEASVGNQDAIAEDIGKKEIDMKLGRDAPEPSAESQNVAEDIAKAEIQIDQGKQQSTKGWFGGFGKGKSKGGSSPASEQASGDEVSTSSQESDPVQGTLQAAEDTVKNVTQDASDELEKFRSARNKSAENRAKKEAEFLARMQAERQEAERKKKEAREKQGQDSIEKARKERDAVLKKQEEQQKLFRENEAKRVAANADRVAKSKPQPPAPEAKAPAAESKAVAAKPADSTDAAQQAKANAQEARKWIQEWRGSQSGGNGASPTAAAKPSENGVAPAGASNGASKSEASEGKPAEKGANAVEARKWIEEWRARS